MNFKSIFWLFNTIIIISFILFTIAAMTLFGTDAFFYFKNMWPFILFFIMLFGVMDYYFLDNWALFQFMENQDWSSLIAWLETRIYKKRQLNRIYGNLLANTALSVSNFEVVQKLEVEIRHRKPKLMASLGVVLGIPIFLEKDSAAVMDYFKPLADDHKTVRREWAQWCYALALGKRGLEQMIELLNHNDISVRIMSLDILSQKQDALDEDQIRAFNVAKNDLLMIMKSGNKGSMQIQKSRDRHLFAVILSEQVDSIKSKLLEGTL